ncbi:MerR family transcriptional regulator [uncultured Lamprocystis sp.]|uniref:MerR family transcriptional regulator n=1 Tax=uncultured Lamprocystis sp. TaxID=543132 RepID=UPI0025F578CF|nr:MerR family transcriptional regulator [uncultured Lamprocystis sp.]
MTEKDTQHSPTYRIGTVSRLTGVPADTLRVWERRYNVVTPIRSEAGTRLYAAEDVGRLTLIKRLVERGDAISSVASLSLAQLRERVSGADLSTPEPAWERPCKIAVMGAGLAGRLRGGDLDLAGVEILGLFERPEALLAGISVDAPDLLLLEYPTVHADQVREIGHLLAQSGATRALLVYHFASRGTLDRLEARHITTKRAPLELAELRRWCIALHQGQAGQSGSAQRRADGTAGLDVDLSQPIPARRFGDAQLACIAMASPTVRCECPHHLVDLVSALSAFEAYSEECEVRHADDAALHAYLHAATAYARATMEDALAKVVAAEGIETAPPAE